MLQNGVKPLGIHCVTCENRLMQEERLLINFSLYLFIFLQEFCNEKNYRYFRNRCSIIIYGW